MLLSVSFFLAVRLFLAPCLHPLCPLRPCGTLNYVLFHKYRMQRQKDGHQVFMLLTFKAGEDSPPPPHPALRNITLWYF